MEEYKVKQIAPNHADHINYYNDKYLEKMFRNEEVIAQPKYDGERMLIHINKGEVYCTSRRHSIKTNRYMENQDKLPILNEYLKPLLNLDYTVIDCECYAKDWSTVVGILHSLPERAIELQKEDDVKFACFDCLFYNGKDIRDIRYDYRLAMLEKLLDEITTDNIHFAYFMTTTGVNQLFHTIRSKDECFELMNIAIDKGFEGIVVKSLEKTYYDKGASLKCKKFETLDVVVCGYQSGRGKYADTVGALEVGYYDEENDKVVKISNVNCGSDEEREFFNSHKTEMLNSVIEVKCQEITDKSLRHPAYIRRREDKNYKMCTKNTIFR